MPHGLLTNTLALECSRKTVIAHIDLDAFYAQVEMQRRPELIGQPVAVIQYSPASVSLTDMKTLRPDDDRELFATRSSVVAVTYEARSQGVKRSMKGPEAKEKCPALRMIQVPVAHGKSDLTIYREAGAKVAAILSRLSVCERASIDEVYLDLTEEAARWLQQQEQQQQQGVLSAQHKALPPTPPDTFEGIHVAGMEDAASWWSRPAEAWDLPERMLATGAAIVVELRAAVQRELGYTCSAGLSHYKLLAKLGSGLHKPAQQTVVPAASVPSLLQDLPVPRLRQLGGKFGELLMSKLDVKTVGELAAIPLAQLTQVYGEGTAQWLARLSHGIDLEEVKPRLLPKSISCGKTFRRELAITSPEELRLWLLELCKEVAERMQADNDIHNRMATTLTVTFAVDDTTSMSRSCAVRRPTADVMAEDALALVKKALPRTGWRVTNLTFGVTNFLDAVSGVAPITAFFKPRRLDLSPPPAAAAAAAAAAGDADCPASHPPSHDGGASTSSGAVPGEPAVQGAGTQSVSSDSHLDDGPAQSANLVQGPPDGSAAVRQLQSAVCIYGLCSSPLHTHSAGVESPAELLRGAEQQAMQDRRSIEKVLHTPSTPSGSRGLVRRSPPEPHIASSNSKRAKRPARQPEISQFFTPGRPKAGSQ